MKMMNLLPRFLFLLLALCFTVLVVPHQVDIYYTNPNLLHVSADAPSSTVTPTMLTTLVYESLGLALPAIELEGIEDESPMPFAADIVEHVQAYMIIVNNGNQMVGAGISKTMSTMAMSTMSKEKIKTYEMVSENKNTEDINNKIMKLYPNAICNGEEGACGEMITDENIENKMKEILKKIKETALKKPVIVVSLSTTEADAGSYIQEMINTLEEQYGNIGVQFLYVDSEQIAIQRRLLDTTNVTNTNTTNGTVGNDQNTTSVNATDGSNSMIMNTTNTTNTSNISQVPGGAPNGYSSDPQLTFGDIESYQLVLWTSIILIVILAYAVSSVINMDNSRDSLLYSKFLTESTHRKMD